MEFVKRIAIGIVGGFVGGALVGLGEAVVVAAVSDATEYWVFLFGAVSYGSFGAVMGGGWAVAASILPLGRGEATVLGTSAGLVVALLGIVVARFRIIRDAFGESLPIASTAGIAVHVGLVVGALVAFLVVRPLLAGSAAKRGALKAGFRLAVASVVVAVLVSSGLSAVAGSSHAMPEHVDGSAKGPNTILIIADTTRADHTGPYGAKNVSTPALDSLASDGVVFERAFSQSSWTRPSIATILTSLYPASHKVMYKTDLLPDQVTTLAEAMKAAGYATAGFVTNINVAPSFNFQQGFDSYRYLAPDYFFGASDSASKLSLYSGMRLIRERFLSDKKWVSNYYQDGETVDETTLPWMDANVGNSFFTLIHFMDPHDPYFEIPYNGKAVARVETPHPAGDRSEELRALYLSNIAYLDEFLGKLFERLKKDGLYDDTLIVFTADHGEEFYEHEGWWHGTTLYEEQIHVPLIVKLPANARAGSRVRDMAGLVDVMPTILAAAGVAVPPAAQGRDLFSSQPPTALYAEEDHEGNVLESVRTSDWKLIQANEGNPRGLEPLELYYLTDDPGEKRNLASSRTDQLASLTAELRRLREAAKSSAVAAKHGELDDAEKARLKMLGYIDENE